MTSFQRMTPGACSALALVLILALVLPRAAAAQRLDKATLRLTVVRSDGSASPETLVTIRGPRQRLTVRVPDSKTLDVRDLEPGVYALTASSIGLCTEKPVSAYLSGGSAAEVRLVLSPCRQTIAVCAFPGSLKSVVTARANNYEALGGQQGTLVLCGPQGAPIPLRGHDLSRPITALDFSADTRFLASGSGDDTVIVWEVATGRLVWRFRFAKGVGLVKFSGDGRFLAAAGESGSAWVQVWDMAMGKEAGQARAEGKVQSLQFTPDSSFVAASTGRTQQFVPVRGGG